MKNEYKIKSDRYNRTHRFIKDKNSKYYIFEPEDKWMPVYISYTDDKNIAFIDADGGPIISKGFSNGEITVEDIINDNGQIKFKIKDNIENNGQIKFKDKFMCKDKKTILTLENNGYKFNSEMSWDANMEDLLDSFYGMCVSATFNPLTVLEAMKEFSESHLEVFENKND